MALPDVQLSLLAFPQRWDGADLAVRLLVLPVGDPTIAPVPAGLPAFAGADWTARAVVLPSPDALYGPDPGAEPAAQTTSFTAAAPDGAADLFTALATQFPIVAPEATAVRLARAESTEIRKHLPVSYTGAFAFERPGPGTSVGDEFGCELRDTVGADAADPKPPETVTWGAVLSFALRQPLLARALGLIHDVTVPVPGGLEHGGWLYVDLDPAGGIVPPVPGAVRSYAALIPPLGEPRTLFAAVLFPVGTTDATGYGDVLAEAAVYDDGFAKIVHAAQAVTADPGTTGHNELKPATDAGIDLGWDDEQVTTWLRRQVEALRVRLGAPAGALEAPLGVSGYRVDVRRPDDPAPQWASLCEAHSVDSDGEPAPLAFPIPPAAAAFTATFDGELTVEAAPVRGRHSPTGTAWLPQHLTRWQGGSLVVADPTLYELFGTDPGDNSPAKTPITPPPATYGADPVPVPLRYGSRYEFRCRLADLTGGGPAATDDAQHTAAHPVAGIRFLRHVPPKALRLETDVPPRDALEPNPAVATVDTIKVWRPLIGYPELAFAGLDDPAVLAGLRADAPVARDEGRGIGANDPDVTEFVVALDVRGPAHDPTARSDGFRTVYEHVVAFGAYDDDAVLDPGPPVELTLDYVDAASLDGLAPAAGSTTLPVPTARDVRLRLTPRCADKPDYFGDPSVRSGLTVQVATRRDAFAEDGLFVDTDDEVALQAMFLQPGPDLAGRVAAELDLTASGLTLAAKPGRRVVFGASAALRHLLAGDGSSLTLATSDELLNRWIVAISIDLGRDWTWDGLTDAGVEVTRRDGGGPAAVVGRLAVPFTVSTSATAGVDPPGTDRRAGTRLVFFDAVDPKPAPGAFPEVLTPAWTLTPSLHGDAEAQDRTITVELPVAVPPRQTPTVVAAGVALSPYVAGPDYASTAPRQRVLWFELDEPIADPNDAVFARVLAYGPDPLLSGELTHLLGPVPDTPHGPTTWFAEVEARLPHPPDPPPLAIDPELLRVIHPNQPEDRSGLGAMTPMPAGDGPSPRHFVVPLPDGVDPGAPELFGFWTYELRIGHARIWSTAQARFGRPLVVKGVQHPPPSLACVAFREPPSAVEPDRIVVSAPYATAVYADERLTDVEHRDPRTHLWALLYGQVTQVDGAGRRNVLLARSPARPRLVERPQGMTVVGTRDAIGVASFPVPAVERVLGELGLPPDTALSVIAVEVFPGGDVAQRSFEIGETVMYVQFDEEDHGDPLGADLLTMQAKRILRCSPLTPVEPAC